jgi:hypothetical protein
LPTKCEALYCRATPGSSREGGTQRQESRPRRRPGRRPRPAFPRGAASRPGPGCRIAVAEHTVFTGDHDLDRSKRTWACWLWLRCRWGWWLPLAGEPRRKRSQNRCEPGLTSNRVPLPAAHLRAPAEGIAPHPDRQHGEAAGRNLQPVARPVGEERRRQLAASSVLLRMLAPGQRPRGCRPEPARPLAGRHAGPDVVHVGMILARPSALSSPTRSVGSGDTRVLGELIDVAVRRAEVHPRVPAGVDL